MASIYVEGSFEPGTWNMMEKRHQLSPMDFIKEYGWSSINFGVKNAFIIEEIPLGSPFDPFVSDFFSTVYPNKAL